MASGGRHHLCRQGKAPAPYPDGRGDVYRRMPSSPPSDCGHSQVPFLFDARTIIGP